MKRRGTKRQLLLGSYTVGFVCYSFIMIFGIFSRYFQPAEPFSLDQAGWIVLLAVVTIGYSSWSLSEPRQILAAIIGIVIAVAVGIVGSRGNEVSMFLMTPFPYLFFGFLGGLIGSFFFETKYDPLRNLGWGATSGCFIYLGMISAMFTLSFISLLHG